MNYNEFIKLIQEYQIAPPVDLDGIARALKLGVYSSKDLPENVSGMISKVHEGTKKYDKGCGYYIVVNGAHNMHRRRFTLAHEIAHYILDRDKIGDNLIDSGMLRSDNVSEPEERAANYLAADILMPWTLLSDAIESGVEVSDLPDKFNVSPVAMSIRLGIPVDKH